MDSETINADRTLGLVEIQASDYISQAENGEYLVHDTKDPHAGALRMHGKGSPRGVLNYTAAFYPCLNIADPEDAEEAAKKKSLEQGRDSIDGKICSMSLFIWHIVREPSTKDSLRLSS